MTTAEVILYFVTFGVGVWLARRGMPTWAFVLMVTILVTLSLVVEREP
jgi:hypothetical protein